MTFTNLLLDTWAAGRTAYGAWCSVANPFSAEIAAASGYDYCCVDLQHGVVDYQAMVPMLQAARLHGAAPVVRVPWPEPWMVMRALDAGAHGVIVPMIDTAEQAAAMVAACRYPPAGMRSYGPTRAAVAHGVSDPDELARVACILMIETEQGLANLAAIAATPGVDALYVGPSDLALTVGLRPGSAAGQPAHEAAIHRVREACERHGLVAGMHCTEGAVAAQRHAEGFRMVTVTGDAVVLRRGLASELADARGAP